MVVVVVAEHILFICNVQVCTNDADGLQAVSWKAEFLVEPVL